MPLYLIESATGMTDRGEVDGFIGRLADAAESSGGEFIEARVTSDSGRVFAVVEQRDGIEPLVERLDASGVVVDDVAPVRLVGAELDEVKATADRGPRYLVEWDLPQDLDMETYLARKKAKSPRYAEVPETSFRRTYVREDLDKCLCFYDAGCEEDVYRAREVVEAPVDRFHELA